MNKAAEYVLDWNKKNGYGTSENDIHETLVESEEIYRKKISSHRWWDTYFIVADIDGTPIGFNQGITTGDDSAWDKGWEFDIDSVCFVEAVQVTKTEYVKV